MDHVALAEFTRDPHPHFARARQRSGLTYDPELGAWLVARSSEVQEVLRRPEDFSSANVLQPEVALAPETYAELGRGPGQGPIVVTSDGAVHRRLRAPHVRGLSTARVREVAPFVRQRVQSLIDGFRDGHAEWMGAFARPLAQDVLGRVLGLAPADVPVAMRGTAALLELFQPASGPPARAGNDLPPHPRPPEQQVELAREVVATHHLLADYVRHRSRDPRPDLCTELVHGLAANAQPPSAEQEGEIVANLVNLLIAGQVTTTAVLGTGLLHLLRHRDQWERLCADVSRLPGAVEEILRYDTAIQGFRRVTTRAVTLAGVELAAGDTVLVAFGSANRDVCGRGEEFDITREPQRHFAFGHGAHGCPGAQLARTQVYATLETVTTRLPGLRLVEPEPVPMLPSLMHRSPERLRVAWPTEANPA
ncbi:cytochrome P450 [Lipingzhangella sp. LS1_29]|uniref:Cytochrome P450 n=1 Tax=Lipingzhangella rawalii TaxID=2055835 RepID=A0ABU2H4Z6_9ACTN|nr:cytochrome P450 [Lipingzhangella rawalii]MDS1270368.1 cytochrome P450 [Lipingzhangella rawalii]